MFRNSNCGFAIDFIPLDSLDMSVCVKTDKPKVVLEAENLKAEFEGLLVSVYGVLNGVDAGILKLRLNWFLSSEKQNTPPVQEHLDKLESLLTPQSILKQGFHWVLKLRTSESISESCSK